MNTVTPTLQILYLIVFSNRYLKIFGRNTALKYNRKGREPDEIPALSFASHGTSVILLDCLALRNDPALPLIAFKAC